MEFFEAMTNYKIEMYRLIKKYYNPDIISPHDDWGMNRNMFFSPDVWREFLKPQLKKMVDATHELGMLYEQHTCGYIMQIYGDMVECGVDMVQIQSVNDLKYIKETYGNKIILRSCFNGQKLGVPGITADEARQEVRNTLETVAKDGGFIPEDIWSTTPEIMSTIREEYKLFAEKYYQNRKIRRN
jgi:uroporphyrinogen decarboxylase